MKSEAYTIESDDLINDETSRKHISTDAIDICTNDPLIEPVIDTDELRTTVDHDGTVNQFRRSYSSLYSQNQTRFSGIISRCTGIFYALFGSFIFTCSGFLIKRLRVDFFDALLARFLLQTCIISSFIFYKKIQLINGSMNLIILQIIRTICGTSGLLLFFLSYRYIPLPDLTTCRYTQVVWTAILAMMVFHERISISTVLAILFTLTGVTLVAQPTFLFNNPSTSSNKTDDTDFESDKSVRLLGLCLALTCAVSISCSMVLNKKLLLSKIPQSIIMLEFSLLTFSLLILMHLYNRFILHKYATQTMFTWQFFVAASVSLLQVLSWAMNQKALELEHPAVISVVQSSDILFAILLQNLFSKVKSNWFVLLGSFLVTTSIFLVGIDKFWKDHKKLSKKIQSKMQVDFSGGTRK